MEQKIVVAAFPANGKETIATVLYEDGKPAEFCLTPAGEKTLLGNVYTGRVEKIQKSLAAAFVRFTGEQSGYLPLTDKELTTIHEGDSVIVQVEKEALKQKLPRLTMNVNLAGRWLVFTSGKRTMNFSRKLHEEDRSRLKKLLKPLFDSSFGVIIRTNAAEAGENELTAEWKQLAEQMTYITAYGQSRTTGTCLYTEDPEWIRMIRQCSFSHLKRIVTDLPEIYSETGNFLKRVDPGNRVALELYDDKMVELFRVYNLTTLFTELTAKRVWLKSGGFLVIEQTEAFCVIDVNSGRYSGNKDYRALVKMTNAEAAEESARQIRLRQLSGTILIDFISMKDPGEREELISLMQSYVSRDVVSTKVIDLTALDIMEITRRKVRRSLAEQQNAPGCR
uniref:ribonuclease E/G n=1 Tax=Eubacterium cellulosolvens TaxID=29322 RepID=UPI0006886F27|nr:ribonuclease E/G [[Eubacterium] cellulosolvens]